MSTFTIFGDIKRYAQSSQLENESASAIFGNVKLDCTRRPIDPGEHRFRLFSVFGNVKLRIPAEVGLEIDGFALFGDIEVENVVSGEEEETGTSYTSENFSTAPARVRVSAFSLFGDVRVVRVPVTTGGASVGFTSARQIEQNSDRVAPSTYEGDTARLERRS